MPLALMRGASSSPSVVTVGMIPSNIPRDPNLPVPSCLFWTGGCYPCSSDILSHAMDINRLN